MPRLNRSSGWAHGLPQRPPGPRTGDPHVCPGCARTFQRRDWFDIHVSQCVNESEPEEEREDEPPEDEPEEREATAAAVRGRSARNYERTGLGSGCWCGRWGVTVRGVGPVRGRAGAQAWLMHRRINVRTARQGW